MKRNEAADSRIKGWAASLLGKIASRRGDARNAETYFRKSLALDPSDTYSYAAFADFLLDDGRFNEAAALLEGRADGDALLLRRAIALQRAGSAEAEAQVALLRARFELQLQNNPDRALALAQQNWKQQKEPADVRILLEAAVAADTMGRAHDVVAWVKEKGLEDRAVHALIARLEERK